MFRDDEMLQPVD